MGLARGQDRVEVVHVAEVEHRDRDGRGERDGRAGAAGERDRIEAVALHDGAQEPLARRHERAATGVRERASEVGLELALEFLDRAAPLVDGTYVMPSFGRYEQAAELVRRIRAAQPLAAVADA
jgi:hypothetical protein